MLDIKNNFPIFKNQTDLVYLDNASTTQMPHMVAEEINKYNTKYKANVHRGAYNISTLATKAYENARKTVGQFINAMEQEIIFTSGTTHGLNFLANSLCQNLKAGDNVVLTRMEHHANLIPWQQASKKYGFELRFIELIDDYTLDLENAKQIIDENTKLVSFVHASNTLGTLNNAREIINLAKNVGATTIVDGAQSVAHMKIDVKALDCDFFVFSGYKVGGPTGIGVLYGKKEILENLEPIMFGGAMISEVSYEKSSWADIPSRFEAGTPNISGAIGLGKALEYLMEIGMENIEATEKELTEYALGKLKGIDALKIIGPDKNRVGVISFILEGVHPHDIATILDRDNIAVRAGHHCTMPLMSMLGIPGTVRVSVWVYNSKEDIDKLVESLKKVITLFR